MAVCTGLHFRFSVPGPHSPDELAGAFELLSLHDLLPWSERINLWRAPRERVQMLRPAVLWRRGES